MDRLFKVTSVATMLLFLCLAYQLLFTPVAFVLDAGQIPSVATTILLRRAAMFMLGVSVLAGLARNQTASLARRAVCASMGTTLSGLATMSGMEYFAGRLNSSILFAMAVESLLATGFAVVLVSDLRAHASGRAETELAPPSVPNSL